MSYTQQVPCSLAAGDFIVDGANALLVDAEPSLETLPEVLAAAN